MVVDVDSGEGRDWPGKRERHLSNPRKAKCNE